MVVAALLLIAAPVGGLGDAARVLSVSAATAVQDIIAARSPGRRVRAEMTKGKVVRRTPIARARPQVRRRVPVAPRPAPLAALLTPPPDRAPLAFLDTPFAVSAPDFAGLAPGTIGNEEACLCSTLLPPKPQGFFIGAGPGGGGGGGVIIVPPGPGGGGGTTPPPGVPEPGAWTMMILGFAALGSAWRRRRVLVRVIQAGLLRLEYRPALS